MKIILKDRKETGMAVIIENGRPKLELRGHGSPDARVFGPGDWLVPPSKDEDGILVVDWFEDHVMPDKGKIRACAHWWKMPEVQQFIAAGKAAKEAAFRKKLLRNFQKKSAIWSLSYAASTPELALWN